MNGEGRFSPCCNAEPMGHQVRGVYDGVLFWVCTCCGSAWNRWPRECRLNAKAQSYVDAVNASMAIATGDPS